MTSNNISYCLKSISFRDRQFNQTSFSFQEFKRHFWKNCWTVHKCNDLKCTTNLKLDPQYHNYDICTDYEQK